MRLAHDCSKQYLTSVEDSRHIDALKRFREVSNSDAVGESSITISKLMSQFSTKEQEFGIFTYYGNSLVKRFQSILYLSHS